MKSSVADQWGIAIRESRRSLAARVTAKAPGSQTKTIETLTDTVRTLEARIAALEAAAKADANGDEEAKT